MMPTHQVFLANAQRSIFASRLELINDEHAFLSVARQVPSNDFAHPRLLLYVSPLTLADPPHPKCPSSTALHPFEPFLSVV